MELSNDIRDRAGKRSERLKQNWDEFKKLDEWAEKD